MMSAETHKSTIDKPLEADGLLVIQSFNVWSQPMLDVLLREENI